MIIVVGLIVKNACSCHYYGNRDGLTSQNRYYIQFEKYIIVKHTIQSSNLLKPQTNSRPFSRFVCPINCKHYGLLCEKVLTCITCTRKRIIISYRGGRCVVHERWICLSWLGDGFGARREFPKLNKNLRFWV